MDITKEKILQDMAKIVPTDRMISDENELKQYSVDRFRKYPDVFGVYTQPIPAALVKVENAEEVSQLLESALG